MAKLVIVESAAKARTLSRYLGVNYSVLASMGHVRDLPKSRLGVNIEDGFQPEWVRLRGKKTGALKKAAKKAEEILLATDPDREGEAIAWHLSELLGVSEGKARRISFHEVTERAVKRALGSPGPIDMRLVRAQHARRVLDRIFGYKLSPLLWKKIARGLSAGRVQSVALRLLVGREREIRRFTAEEYWEIEAKFEDFCALLSFRRAPAGSAVCPECSSPLERRGGRFVCPEGCVEAEVEPGGAVLAPVKVRTKDEADAVRAILRGKEFTVESFAEKEKKQTPPPPFHTSAMQQAASSRLGFSPKKTMRLAQRLYEGVDLPEGPTGLITYMRTDSFRIAEHALRELRGHIEREYGRESLAVRPRFYRSRRGAQEAHEAVRPTSAERTPQSVKSSLGAGELKLYELIWRRFVATQMSDFKCAAQEAILSAGEFVFKAAGERVVSPGFRKVWPRWGKAPQEIPALESGTKLDALRLEPAQRFTEGPPRYTEASLVKVLEGRGIGRPSTYATIASTVQERGYATKEKKALHATELGEMVCDMLVEHFPRLMDVGFTAEMEEDLDRIERGEREWAGVVREFYGPFERALERAEEKAKVENGKPTERKCPNCDNELVEKVGRRGRFMGCSGYPECRYTEPVEGRKDWGKCPECGKVLALRTGRRGEFLGCTGYPGCRYTRDVKENSDAPKEVCEECGSPMVVRRGKRGAFLGCSAYPKCKNTKPMPKT